VGGFASISGNRGNSILVNFWATWCERSDELSVLGKVSGGSEYWYMVRTKNGLAGWARESEVEAASNQK
jgi:hypothetical protein